MNRATWVFSCLVLVSLVAVQPERVSAQSTDIASPTGAVASNGAASIAPTGSASVAQANLLAGIWENRCRFVEFAADGRLRIVLKPYYGFVYEDTGWMPYSLTAADDPADASPYVCRLAVRYTGEKIDQLVPAAVIGDGFYVRFFRRLPDSLLAPVSSTPAPPATLSGSILNGAGVVASPSGASSAPAMPASSSGASTAAEVTSSGSAIPAGSSLATPTIAGTVAPLAGFWMAAGNADALRLYKSEPVTEFYCYYFSGANYYRIRYWADDVRFKDLRAVFTGKDGLTLTVPKFIRIGDVLYTCITSTGVKLRNYEAGTYALKGRPAFAETGSRHVQGDGTGRYRTRRFRAFGRRLDSRARRTLSCAFEGCRPRRRNYRA